MSDKIFYNKISNKYKFFNILVIGLFSAGFFFFANKFFSFGNISIVYNYYFLLLIFIVILLHFVISRLSISNIYNIWIHFLMFLFLFAFIKTSDMSDDILYYYIFVSLTEEFIKYSLGYNTYLSKWKIKSDIILFGIIAWIWFGFMENILYLYYYFVGGDIGGIANFSLGRGIFGFLIHFIFTSVFVYLIYIYKSKSENISNIKWDIIYYIVFLWSLVFVTFGHTLYNLFVSKYFVVTSVSIVFFGYIWISYLFFLSDRWYYEYYNKTNTK